jgi:hypothetical protein
MFRQPLINSLLHLPPRILQPNPRIPHLVLAIVRPPRRIPHLGIDVLKRDREMDVHKVKVFESPVREGPFDGGDDVFAVKSGPYFCDDEEVFSLDETLGDGATDTLSAFAFVVVVLGAVEEAVACFDGIDDLIWGGVLVDFPPTTLLASEQRSFREGGADKPKPTCGIGAPVGRSLIVGTLIVIFELFADGIFVIGIPSRFILFVGRAAEVGEKDGRGGEN